MDAGNVVTIRTNSGQTKAGLNFLLEVFEKLPYLERDLDVTDTELQCLKDAKEVVGKIYDNVVTLL